MKFLIMILLSNSVYAADALYKSVSYYEPLGSSEKFRVEIVSRWPACQETKLARKIFLDATNELREIAIWRDGKMEEGGASNKLSLLAEVNAYFAKALEQKENPCFKKSVPEKKEVTPPVPEKADTSLQ